VVTMVVTLVCFGAVPALTIATLGQGWWALAVSVSVGGGAYAAVLWRLRRTLLLTELAGVRRRRRR
jgi:hypothetical protein